jgi:hypothetical protein
LGVAGVLVVGERPLRPHAAERQAASARVAVAAPPKSSFASSPASRQASRTAPTPCAEHVGILHAAAYGPPVVPLLIEASQLGQFDHVVALAREHQHIHPHLWRRVGHQAKFVASTEGEKVLDGGLVRLDLVMGEV